MNLEETLEAVRAEYLAFSNKAFASIQKRASSAVRELPLQLGIVDPDEYRSLWRIDIAHGEEEPTLIEAKLDEKNENSTSMLSAWQDKNIS
ncbi:MAG: hypothetical protein ACFCBU_05015 [Cyanophyceae cyanobacterium]